MKKNQQRKANEGLRANFANNRLVRSPLGRWFVLDLQELSSKLEERFDKVKAPEIRVAARLKDASIGHSEIDQRVAESKRKLVPLMTRYVAQELADALEDMVTEQISLAIIRADTLREEDGRVVGGGAGG
jgi:hypothetical protein